jgi:Arc/MetJ-type ribon-helix-helix transcriptional regulator
MSETEKITINLGVVDLGKIDLLVEQGFYTTRTDFIRAAIRSQLLTHNTEIQATVSRKSMAMGILLYNSRDLEKRLEKGEMMKISIAGMLILDSDISPELAAATIESIKVLGVLKASDAVKEALADRIIN